MPPSQARNTVSTARLAALDQHTPEATRAICLPMLHVRGLDHHRQPRVGLLARTGHASLPCMEATSRHSQGTAQRTHRVVRLLRLDPGVPRDGVSAKHASAFFRRSEEHTSELQSLMPIPYAVF